MDSEETRTPQLKRRLTGFWSEYIVCLQTRFFRQLIKIDSTMIRGQAGRVELRIDMPVLKFWIQGDVHNFYVVFIFVVWLKSCSRSTNTRFFHWHTSLPFPPLPGSMVVSSIYYLDCPLLHEEWIFKMNTVFVFISDIQIFINPQWVKFHVAIFFSILFFILPLWKELSKYMILLRNDPGKVESIFFCYAAMCFPDIGMFSFLHRNAQTYRKAVYATKCL